MNIIKKQAKINNKIKNPLFEPKSSFALIELKH
jgi:hypothetical protein